MLSLVALHVSKHKPCHQSTVCWLVCYVNIMRHHRFKYVFNARHFFFKRTDNLSNWHIRLMSPTMASIGNCAFFPPQKKADFCVCLCVSLLTNITATARTWHITLESTALLVNCILRNNRTFKVWNATQLKQILGKVYKWSFSFQARSPREARVHSE